MTAYAKISEFTPLEPASTSFEKSISIFIFSDHPVFRSGLTWKFDDSPDIDIAGESGSLIEATTLAQSACPDVIIADMRIGDGSPEGAESVMEISKRLPGVPVIVYSEFYSASYRERMARAGASAFVMKSSGASQLISAIYDAVAEPAVKTIRGAA